MKNLIIKYLEGKINSPEQIELLDWLRKGNNRNEFNQVLSEWEDKQLAEGISRENLSGWTKLQSKLLQEAENIRKRQLQLYRFLSYAAIFVLLISIPSIWFSLRPGKAVSVLSYTRMSTENGQVAKAYLPDGSEVWLNSGSSIRYNNRFSIDNRDLEIEGEAFFKAVKNKDLPMIVSCSELKVKVLGTSFNVMSYRESRNIQVTLEEGAVSLYKASAPNEIKRMQSGEMATYSRNSKQITIDPVNTVHFTSWKDGIINIYNLTLEDLVTRLERRYNQKFEIDEAAKSLRYTLSIKNETLNQVLNLVKIINPVDPVQKNDVIYLKYNPERAKKMNQEK